jgi:DNA-binding MarR family transcriptional regulator
MIERIDAESRATDGDHLALRVWLRLLTCTNLIEGRARTNLRLEFDTTLPRFDLMAQLERNAAGLKMSQISRRMMVTGGNITRITDQLVDEGLVARDPSPDDRRSFVVRLTPAGRRAFAAMAEEHERWIVEVFSALSHKERLHLYALLAKVKARVARVERSVRDETR